MPLQPYATYVVEFQAVAVSAAQDLFEIKAPADAVVTIDELIWDQANVSATNEILDMALKVIDSTMTSGSGGTTQTPMNVIGGGLAAGSTCERNNTTQATGGVTKCLHPEGVNAWHTGPKRVAPGQSFVLSPTDYFVWSLDDAPTTALTLTGYVKFSEYGG